MNRSNAWFTGLALEHLIRRGIRVDWDEQRLKLLTPGDRPVSVEAV